MLHIRWVALYLPVQTLVAGVPLFVLGLAVLAACAGFAWACARTARYTITNERCMLSFGIALTATLSMPLRRIAIVSVALRGDGTGDVPMALKPGRAVAFLKLWPHVRPWQFRQPQPMLRGIEDAAHVAALPSQAVEAVSPGRLTAIPAHPGVALAASLAPTTSAAAGG